MASRPQQIGLLILLALIGALAFVRM